MAGQEARAREILAELDRLARERYVMPYHLAYVHTGLGEHERAIDLLEAAEEERGGGVYGIKGSFLFTPLRGHPRFRALLRRMNLGEPGERQPPSVRRLTELIPFYRREPAGGRGSEAGRPVIQLS